uniref:Uncharacterized protein n=1 Tax=Anguilla anguilla TaxID=7936 RepID=A0A0E9X7X3_ANGAN
MMFGMLRISTENCTFGGTPLLKVYIQTHHSELEKSELKLLNGKCL